MCDVTGDAPLELERYATLAAESDAGRPIGAILEREGLTDETWARAQAYWLKRMADEARRKRFATTTRYQAVFKAKRKIFAAAIGRAPGAHTDPAPPPIEPLQAADRELAAPIAADLPRVDAPVPPAPPSSLGAAIREAPHPPPMAFTYQPEPPAPAPAPPPRPSAPEAPPPRPFSSTIVEMEAPPITAPMPFAAPASAPASPPSRPGRVATGTERPPAPEEAPPPELRPKQNLGSTMAVDSSAIAQARAALLPFRGDASASAPAPRAVPPRVPTGTAPVGTPEEMRRALAAELDDEPPRTSILDPERVAEAIRRATPFPGTPTAAAPAPHGPATDDDDGGSPRTAFFDASSLPAAGALPFGASRDGEPGPAPGVAAPPAPSSPSSPKKFTINVFASLTAELAEHPELAATIRDKYGVSAAEHVAESEKWTAEFQKNDELRRRYLGIVSRYRQYLVQRKPG